MDGLEHAGVAPLGVDVARGCDAQAAGQSGGQVTQDIGVQIGRHQGVQGGGPVDHAGGGGIDQLFVPAHIGELQGDLRGNFVPHHHRMALGVGLGHHGQQLAWARLRQAKGIAHDALHTGAGHDGHVGGHFDRVALVGPTAHAGVFALGVFAHDDPVQVFGAAALERRINAGQDAGGAHIGVLVKALANFQAQTPQGDVIGNVRVAGRAKQNGVHAAQGIQAVGGHHLAMGAVPIAAPSKGCEFKPKVALRLGQSGQDLLAGGDDLFANAVSRDASDAVGFHAVLKRAEETALYLRSPHWHCPVSRGVPGQRNTSNKLLW